MYCDPVGSESSIQAQFTLSVLGTGIVKLLAPILPHLSIEFMTHHPSFKELDNSMQKLLTSPDIPRDLLSSSEFAIQAVEFTQRLRSMLFENSNKIDFPKTVRPSLHVFASKCLFRPS